MKCVVMVGNEFLTPRRNIGSMYTDRTGWSDDMKDAKVFQSKGAATNSARANLGNDGEFEVFEVELKIVRRL